MARAVKKSDQESNWATEPQDFYRVISSLTSDYGYILEVGGGRVLLKVLTGDFERVTGYGEKELRARWEKGLFHPDDAASARERMERLLTGQADSCELRIVTSARETRWIRDHALPVRDEDGGRVVRIYGAAQDITEQKNLQEQFLHAQKMETIGRLAGGIAHDFNNILTAVIGNLDLLRFKPMGEEERLEVVHEARSAASRAAELTQRLLTFARKQPAMPQLLSLRYFLPDLEGMLARLLGEDVHLDLDLASEVWPVRVDRSLLTQVFINLTVNARDAMSSGGTLSIRVSNGRSEEIEPLFETGRVAARECVKIVVRDSGVGMDEETRDRLFEPFFSTKAGKGSGLGLATVYGIIEQCGGTITVRSERGSGTTFRILLPRAPGTETEETALQSALPETEDDYADHLRGDETILLVEDDPYVLKATKFGLSELGYSVLEAPDGFSALILSRHYDGQIDAVVSDLVMPQMNGFEFAEQLCSERDTVKVIFVSGYADLDLIDRGIRTFGAKFLGKPYPLAKLAATLREVLEQ